MSLYRALYVYLWVAPHVLQVALAMMLVCRKLVKEFPAFFLYTLGEVLQFVVLYTMNAIHQTLTSHSKTFPAGPLPFSCTRNIHPS